MEYHEALQFYQHPMEWANRLILGDSLVAMKSLAKREDLAGKVQMIYMDPPYGIKFASNFQPTVGNRNVTDRESDLTREPEMVKAYRDTWTLGVHSYLSYLRDRLHAAKDLLSDSGSIFVQIGDENVHRVRAVMDEVFGSENFLSEIVFLKTTGKSSGVLDNNFDIILWYGKNRSSLKFRRSYFERTPEDDYNLRFVQDTKGTRHRISDSEVSEWWNKKADFFRPNPLTSQTPSATIQFPVEFQGSTYSPGKRGWSTNELGMSRLKKADRLLAVGNTLTYIRFLRDAPMRPHTSFWTDTRQSGFGDEKLYVVQTAPKVIERCLLMTTDPGDLVLDPTCGSGTTAYVAEQWGRRWITVDASRVALALARQRVLTAKFDQYKTRDGSNKLHARSFIYKSVPHIQLKTIAQNTALDPIFAKWGPVLAEKLATVNTWLKEVTPELRTTLLRKLEAKRRRWESDDPVTEADERRWNLPKDRWEEWQVPFDTDPDWPQHLQSAVEDYRAAWHQKMDEVNACIAAAAEPEELVDQPEVVRGVVRVSGPFTVEAVQPAEESLDATEVDDDDATLETFGDDVGINMADTANAEAYLDRMIRLLHKDGVRFPENKSNRFARLESLREGNVLHAEGEWANGDGVRRRVAVAFGPQYGPVTAKQVDECLRAANRRGYDDLVIAGFSFDGAAQAEIQADPNPEVRCHMAHINPDVNMGDLLKETPSSQLFTVFGSPRTEVTQTEAGEYVVEMQGVDIYDPVSNSVYPSSPNQVAAWFLDSDYDGRTFCITQAFFPDASAWDKLARALKGTIPEEAFAAFSGTVSLPFPAGKHKRAAVKVIDPRGNEVMAVHALGEVTYG